MRRMLLTVFGLGLSPKAPGTIGSLPPVAIALALVWLAAPLWMVNITLLLIGIIFGWACVRFGTLAERSLGEKDPQEIVADEVAGQVLPLLFLPWMVGGQDDAMVWNIALAATAFITFRLFDITKPPPVRATERLGGGTGILVDDIVAGVYALIVTQLVALLVLPMVL